MLMQTQSMWSLVLIQTWTVAGAGVVTGVDAADVVLVVDAEAVRRGRAACADIDIVTMTDGHP